MTTPRLGFLGLGWIGLNRLRAALRANVEIVALADPDPDALSAAGKLVPSARRVEDERALFALPLDGVVIATPSGLHAAQCERAFEQGLAVFCQKPLARTALETSRILAAAEQADRALGVDFSYRECAGLVELRRLVQAGELGRVFTASLTFHNAYGPDKSWATDIRLSGGGCLMDLGVHLVDALYWVLGARDLLGARTALFAGGVGVCDPHAPVEDYALAQLELAGGLAASIACSWHASLGAPAQIELTFSGTRGAASFQNVAGSFYDFRCRRFDGERELDSFAPADDWGGRALLGWIEQLRVSARYVARDDLLLVARTLDALYGRDFAQPPHESTTRAAERTRTSLRTA